MRHKLATGKYETGIAAVLQFDEGAGPVTRGHKYKLRKNRCETKLRQNSFAEKIINTQNGLPPFIVESTSVFALERRVIMAQTCVGYFGSIESFFLA